MKTTRHQRPSPDASGPSHELAELRARLAEAEDTLRAIRSGEPTVVRKLPKPVRTIIGDLSDTDRVLVGLDLRAIA